ncbi:MAG: PfkB family carbohydrate kinase [Bryobacteraceae bacterium]
MRRVTNKHLTIVGLGEVLFDVFEDGTETLGGAPLNVAVHAHQLASPLGLGEGVVASRIGADPHGSQILDLLHSRGMSTGYVETDSEHPTGTVSVFMRDGEPGYQIESGAAWDFISASEFLDELAEKCDAVCFGSLAQRSPASRESIQRFVRKAKNAVRLYDVNLRRNTLTNEAGYSAEVIEESCELATMMKLNGGELVEICDMFGMDRGIESLLTRFPVEAVILTRGAEGTALITRSGEFTGHAPPAPLLDAHPVGAGDACAAGILFGSVLGWHPDDAIDLANRMGTWVASQLSATPLLPDSILAFVREKIRIA